MAPTRINTKQILDESVTRDDLNSTTPGLAVAKKLIQGENVVLTSTGADAGTGDVTVSVPTFPWSGITSTPKFTVDTYTKPNIIERTGSGWYQYHNANKAEGWPNDDYTWYHLISSTHDNITNYYALQFAAPFFRQGLYFRNTQGNGDRSWNEIWHTFNLAKPAKLDSTNIFELDNTFNGSISVAGRIHASTSNLGGVVINFADDGNISDLQDGFMGIRFSEGVKIHSGIEHNNPVHQFNRTGDAIHSRDLYVTGSVYPGYISIRPQDVNSIEGGEMQFKSTPSSSDPADTQLDVYDGRFRIFGGKKTVLFGGDAYEFGSPNFTESQNLRLMIPNNTSAGIQSLSLNDSLSYLFLGRDYNTGGGLYFQGSQKFGYNTVENYPNETVFYRRVDGLNIPVMHYSYIDSTVKFNKGVLSYGIVALESEGVSRLYASSDTLDLRVPLTLYGTYDLNFQADDPGDIVFRKADATEQARIFLDATGNLQFSATIGAPAANFTVGKSDAYVNGHKVWNDGNLDITNYYTKPDIQSRNLIPVGDTRFDNPAPKDIINKKSFQAEFKIRGAIDAPGRVDYGGLLTLTPWLDGSGGSVTQVFASEDGLFTRRANISSDTWSTWSPIALYNKNVDLTTTGEVQLGWSTESGNSYIYANTSDTRTVGLFDSEKGVVWNWASSKNLLSVYKRLTVDAPATINGKLMIHSNADEPGTLPRLSLSIGTEDTGLDWSNIGRIALVSNSEVLGAWNANSLSLSPSKWFSSDMYSVYGAGPDHTSNGMFTGGVDQASFAANNLELVSWFGIGFKSSIDNSTRLFINTRDGNLASKGTISTNYGYLQKMTSTLMEDYYPSNLNALDVVNSATVKEFKYTDDSSEYRLGFDSTSPWLVSSRDAESVKIMDTIALLMKAVQELSAKITPTTTTTVQN